MSEISSLESASWIALVQNWSKKVHLSATRIILCRLSPTQQAEMEVSRLGFSESFLLILIALLNSF